MIDPAQPDCPRFEAAEAFDGLGHLTTPEPQTPPQREIYPRSVDVRATVAALTIKLADVEAERDAAADNARHWRDQHDLAENRIADLTTERGSLRDMVERKNDRIAHLDELIREAGLAVRLVNDWATWTDASLNAYVDAHLWHGGVRAAGFAMLAEIRRVARDRLGDDGFTIPPAYDDEARERAITAASQVVTRGDGGSTVRSVFGRIVVGKIVDAVADALGMRRPNSA